MQTVAWAKRNWTNSKKSERLVLTRTTKIPPYIVSIIYYPFPHTFPASDTEQINNRRSYIWKELGFCVFSPPLMATPHYYFDHLCSIRLLTFAIFGNKNQIICSFKHFSIEHSKASEVQKISKMQETLFKRKFGSLWVIFVLTLSN